MNKRRSFLRQAGLLSAGVFMAPAIISCSSNTENTAEDANAENAGEHTAAATDVALGIQLYSLRDLIQKDVKGVIAKVAEAGYKKVETYGYSKENGYFGLDAKAFGELLKSHGLVSPSGHYGMDPYLSGENPELLQTYIDAAKEIGQTYITIPYLGDKLRSDAAGYRQVAKRMNEAAAACKEAGLKLAYHNHDFEFQQFGDVTGYDILLKETDPELVKMELDLYWVARAGKDPVAMMQANPGRYVMWHVKDMDKNDNTLNTEIGNGSIDYKTIFSKAQNDVEHIYVEQENFSEGMDPYKSIRQSHDYIVNTLLKA